MITSDPALLAAAAALRTAVFVHEQHVDPAVEADGADGRAQHAVIMADGQAVATGRLVEEAGTARLGRIAVRAERRGQGLGAVVVAELTAAAATAGLPRLRLHAQAPVVGFYERLGWRVVGPPDVEAGREHRWMMLDLLPGVRHVEDRDAAALQTLVGDCFAQYPGCVLELDALDAWMRAPASGYAAKRGELWVVPDGENGLHASIGWAPGSVPEAVELKTLYVAATARRRGVATALVGLVERAARQGGARFVDLWTDTRFLDAHRLYERLGYSRLPGQRALHDVSATMEYPYRKIL